MKLTYLRQFLVEKMIEIIYANQRFSGKDVALFLKDSKFDINPANDDAVYIFQAFDNLEEMETSQWDADIVSKHVLAFAMKLDNFSLGRGGVSLKTLNALANRFYTDEIYVHGDGHYEVYSEETTFAVQEVILYVMIKDWPKIIEAYEQWLAQTEAQKLIEDQDSIHARF